jgi:hypothetical protein
MLKCFFLKKWKWKCWNIPTHAHFFLFFSKLNLYTKFFYFDFTKSIHLSINKNCEIANLVFSYKNCEITN